MRRPSARSSARRAAAASSSKSSTSLRAHPQHRVRVLADLRKRHSAPRESLGVEIAGVTQLARLVRHGEESSPVD